jgi:hypothetical protein
MIYSKRTAFILVCLLCLCAADQNPKVDKMTQDYNRHIFQLASDFQHAIDKENQRYGNELDVAIKVAMKDGDLKKANELSDLKLNTTLLGASAKLYDQVVLQCHYTLKATGSGPMNGFGRQISLMPFGQLVDINKFKGYQPYWAIQSSSEGHLVLLIYLPDLDKPVLVQCDVPHKGEFTSLMFDKENDRRNFVMIPDNPPK